ncbi:ABC transporter ATP-binding protein [Thermophagus xiamenensis]|uniref:ATP-binding cassette, subfamily B n=1 Tax=Thermophagus xiamenensis TaxID=385682 RepID=A0A1I1VHX9_9BACT|nr:ABC transporter ATP-binding protein [Thermophagus xiamenensis]SFD81628.1 ATP-binding cassette, subfamily B [Thermophagus xiamenensis]
MISKLAFLLKYTYRYRWWYLGGFIFLGLTIWTSVTIPDYIRRSIDTINKGALANHQEFYRYIIILFALAFVLIIVRTLSRILIFVPARLIEKQLKGELFRKLSSFGKDYFDQNSTGSIISRVNNDINGVRLITGFGLLQLGNILFSLSVTPYKMWQLSPTLTLYCFIPIVTIFIIVRVGLVIMVKNTHRRMDALQKLSGMTISFLSGNSIIKSYNVFKWAESEQSKVNLSLFKYTMKITWVRSFIMPLLGNLEQILKIVILFSGGIFVIKGSFTIGELTAYIAYSALLTHPIMGLGWVLTIMQQGFVGISSLQTILNRKGVDSDKKPLPPYKQKKLLNKGITLKNLTYTYPNGNHSELKNISFTIKPGQTIGITGKVGSGKTTLINILNGYLRPDPGQVFFGEIDITELTGQDIRSVVKTVSQDLFLFSDTIENNIRFGSKYKNVTLPLNEVLFRSALAEELTRFPQQEKTLVGEKGIMLSGGQKQRISLARALYSPSKLLILDDVFSAVDTDTERFMIRELFDHRPAETLIIVSNRISVLEKTDFTVVLNNGTIEAIGSHEDLLKQSDFYRKTWEIQK